jgi:hypothetical protein
VTIRSILICCSVPQVRWRDTIPPYEEHLEHRGGEESPVPGITDATETEALSPSPGWEGLGDGELCISALNSLPGTVGNQLTTIHTRQTPAYQD